MKWKKICGFSYSKNMANFEAFLLGHFTHKHPTKSTASNGSSIAPITYFAPFFYRRGQKQFTSRTSGPQTESPSAKYFFFREMNFFFSWKCLRKIEPVNTDYCVNVVKITSNGSSITPIIYFALFLYNSWGQQQFTSRTSGPQTQSPSTATLSSATTTTTYLWDLQYLCHDTTSSY